MSASNVQETRLFNDAEGYTLPADKEEGARLNSQHRLITQLLNGKQILAPIALSPGDEVLECATGTGIWLLDIASQHPPDVRFTGIDLSPHLFPPPEHTPANATFEHHSVLVLPPSFTSRFALVHQRLLVGGLRATEWPEALREHFRVLRPGGWVQLCEVELGAKAAVGPHTARVIEMHTALLRARAMEPDCALRLAEWAEAAGFVNVQTLCKHMPFGNGAPFAAPLEATYVALKTPMVAFNGSITGDEYDRWVQEMCDEWKHVEGGATVPFHWMRAQKPLEE